MAKGNLISGEYRNKVGGYVGAKWKNKAYFRAYVVPKNPKTTEQKRVRSNFKTLMAIGAGINAGVLKPYTAKKFKGMSELNRFMKINQPFVNGDGSNPQDIQIFMGGALPCSQAQGAIAAAGNACVITFTPPTQLGTPSKYVAVGFAYNYEKNLCVAGVKEGLTGGQQSTIEINVPNESQDKVYWGVALYVETEIDGILNKLNSNSNAGEITVA